jgi:hypothetical protein
LESFSSRRVILEFNESFSLVVKEFNLGQSTIWLVEGSQRFLSGIERESLAEKFLLTIVLVRDSRGGLSSDGVFPGWLLG